ncbi:hypothetical protein [uncultured Alteromonas sp.]|jgi:hypothetical protein|uniref:hypothetical protein n=1 Tax=uncultured Alteromonas sp. TaxID=179113 RepID=UPI0025FA981C|nr:hypothetical protein [uncultured Alteromonas sp.]
MKTIQHNQVIEDISGKKYVRINPGTGTVTIFGKNHDGSFGPTAFKTFDQNTPGNQLRFYLPTVVGEGWKFEITGNAVAEYH